MELHHRLALAQGGTDDTDNLVLLHATCHAAETQLQELSGLFTPFHTIKSQMNPTVLRYFTELEKPTQGEREGREEKGVLCNGQNPEVPLRRCPRRAAAPSVRRCGWLRPAPPEQSRLRA